MNDVPVIDEASVSVLREAVRAACQAAGVSNARAERLVSAASELAHNQLRHASGGEASVRGIVRAGTAGVEVVARDRGPGIAAPGAAIRGDLRGETAGLGIGLSAAHRLADEMDLDTRSGEGTTVHLRTFARPLPRRELAIVGRPLPGEALSGDDAFFVWQEDSLLLAVADGLGHGPAARLAARHAVALVRAAHAHDRPAEVLARSSEALAQTRGAAITIARLDANRVLTVSGLGNVALQLLGVSGDEAFRSLGSPGVLGGPGRPRIVEEQAPLPADRFVLALFTDGLTSRVSLRDLGATLRAPAAVIADELLTRHARGNDDALVLVATG